MSAPSRANARATARPMWRLEPDWNRSYRRLLAYLAAGGTVDGPANRTGGKVDPSFRPGTWLRSRTRPAPNGS
ncbi:hypothetical protein GCM10010441_12890 [Kitasatospora paracochleata]